MSDREDEWKIELDLSLGISSSPRIHKQELDITQINLDFISSKQFFPQFSDWFEIGETSSAKRKVQIRSDGEGIYSVPHDLLMEVAKEFRVKDLLRFLCVSKLWESTIRSREFTDAYLSKSLARSQERQGLLLTFVRGDKCFVFSSSRPENADETSLSSSSVATYNMTCPSPLRVKVSPSVHGLICYGPASGLVVHNPCTRKSLVLPRINSGRRKGINHYVGYDPIDSVYKVLCATKARPQKRNEHGIVEELRVLTLGNERLWRMVENVPFHSSTCDEMCINGSLYYGAFAGVDLNEPMIMRFDVKYEMFDLIAGPENAGAKFLTSSSKLTAYKGKLVVLFFEDQVVMWVLKDVASAEWCKMSFDLPSLIGFTTDLDLQLFTTNLDLQLFSATNAGEVILAPRFVRASTFRVVYYDPEKDSFRKIEIEGITENWWYCRAISVFPYHVENLLFL